MKKQMKTGELIGLLSMKRPAYTEGLVAEQYVLPLGGQLHGLTGNYIIQVGESRRVLFSSHLDTVHRSAGFNRIRQSRSCLSASGEPLGADDGAGVWLMNEMVRSGVEGTYIYHIAEEVGGVGSSDMAELCPSFLEGVDMCIAFDRRGTGDVVTHQRGERTASDQFAYDIGTLLGMGHKPVKGIFTDSANYSELVRECTNLSVGYQNEHTGRETLDLDYLYALRDRCVEADWQGLVAYRDLSRVKQERWSDYFELSGYGVSDSEVYSRWVLEHL